MAKTYIVQRSNSKGVRFLATGPKAKEIKWTADPMDAYTFEDTDAAEAVADRDSIGGDVIRLKKALADYNDREEQDKKAVKTAKGKKAPALEDLEPLPRSASTKRVAVKTKEEAPKKVAKKAAPAPAKPAKKAVKTASAERSGRRDDSVEKKLTAMRLPVDLVKKLQEHGGGNVTQGVLSIVEPFFARRAKK